MGLRSTTRELSENLATGGGASEALRGTADGDAQLRIGEAAELVGVSCRTLRYYEELELVVPAGHSAGGARRYTVQDVARLRRIRELQELLGFDLGEIRAVLRSEDQLADLRSEYNSGTTLERRKAILAEATQINERLKETVRAKQESLAEMMRELEERSKRHRSAAKKLESEAIPTK
jgi:MerR family transcriptional regulator, repressor of the yfmOP operon